MIPLRSSIWINAGCLLGFSLQKFQTNQTNKILEKSLNHFFKILYIYYDTIFLSATFYYILFDLKITCSLLKLLSLGGILTKNIAILSLRAIQQCHALTLESWNYLFQK